MKPGKYFVYMIECRNGAHYVGYATDPQRRYREHLAGSAKCKYTRSFPPVRLAAVWPTGDSLSETLKCERRLKRLDARQKAALAKNPGAMREISDIKATDACN